MDQVVHRGRLRRSRSRHRRSPVDGDAGGLDLRLQLRAARGCRVLRGRRRAGGLRARLHRGMDQGDDAGPLRPALIGGVELLERRGSRCRAQEERERIEQLSAGCTVALESDGGDDGGVSPWRRPVPARYGRPVRLLDGCRSRIRPAAALARSARTRLISVTLRCLRCLLLVMCTHPFAKEALTLHLARSEGHERYFGGASAIKCWWLPRNPLVC